MNNLDQMTRKVVLLAGQLGSLGGDDMWRKVRRIHASWLVLKVQCRGNNEFKA